MLKFDTDLAHFTTHSGAICAAARVIARFKKGGALIRHANDTYQLRGRADVTDEEAEPCLLETKS